VPKNAAPGIEHKHGCTVAWLSGSSKTWELRLMAKGMLALCSYQMRILKYGIVYFGVVTFGIR
tara:strand:+ start:508 stop:696 length:189 start_codon:yes stop_codon:yes gene_type:complete